VCCESGTKNFVVVSIDLDCVVRREGGSASGWRLDLKERNKARFAGRLIISLLWSYICLSWSEKRQFGFDRIGAFLWHPFCVKRAGREQAGNGGDPGFYDY
jgi:hypothetical protein